MTDQEMSKALEQAIIDHNPNQLEMPFFIAGEQLLLFPAVTIHHLTQNRLVQRV